MTLCLDLGCGTGSADIQHPHPVGRLCIFTLSLSFQLVGRLESNLYPNHGYIVTKSCLENFQHTTRQIAKYSESKRTPAGLMNPRQPWAEHGRPGPGSARRDSCTTAGNRWGFRRSFAENSFRGGRKRQIPSFLLRQTHDEWNRSLLK